MIAARNASAARSLGSGGSSYKTEKLARLKSSAENNASWNPLFVSVSILYVADVADDSLLTRFCSYATYFFQHMCRWIVCVFFSYSRLILLLDPQLVILVSRRVISTM